jgi:hypothetical protein
MDAEAREWLVGLMGQAKLEFILLDAPLGDAWKTRGRPLNTSPNPRIETPVGHQIGG